MELLQKQQEKEKELKKEKERLAIRNWWRRPSSEATSSWVRTGGARATSNTSTTSASARWEHMEDSMVANPGARDGQEDEAMDTDLSLEEVTLVGAGARDEENTNRGQGRDRDRGRTNRGEKRARARDDHRTRDY